MPRLTLNIMLPGTRAVLAAIHRLGENMALDLTNLRAEVAEAKTVMEGATALLRSQVQQLRDLAEQIANGTVDPAEIQAIADELDAATDGLASAVGEGTEPEPTPEPEPEPTPEP